MTAPTVKLPRLITPINQWRVVNPSTVMHTCSFAQIRDVIEDARHDLLALESQRAALHHMLADVYAKIDNGVANTMAEGRLVKSIVETLNDCDGN